MYSTYTLLLWSLVIVGHASPVERGHNHVVHEKRDIAPSGWAIRERLSHDTRLPLRIGLKQRNLHLGPQYLDQVSNPQSKNYAKHWSAEQIRDMFSPT